MHGVGGLRHQYQPTQTFRLASGDCVPIHGDCHRLIDCYRSVGIASLYVADLDGIQLGRWQRGLVESIVADLTPAAKLLVDLGFSHSIKPSDWNWVQALALEHPNVSVVIATECAADVSVLKKAIERMPCCQVAVSFDYKNSRWLSKSTSPQQWVDACRKESIETAIGLDLAAVGSQSIQLTLSLCKRLCRDLAVPRYITGGGIRNGEDAMRLIEAGAESLLVASLFAS